MRGPPVPACSAGGFFGMGVFDVLRRREIAGFGLEPIEIDVVDVDWSLLGTPHGESQRLEVSGLPQPLDVS